MTILGAILPAYVECAEAFTDVPEDRVFPTERDAVANAIPRRRAEFATGRACARAALHQLGIPAVAIGRGPAGAPMWPAGVVGTITHCDGYRAAAVARADDVRTLGCDAETHEPLPDGVTDLIAFGPERERIDTLTASHPEVHWDRLVFSAKESVYKAWYPLTGRWLGHEEAAVTASTDGSFEAALLIPGPGISGFSGRWFVRQGLIVTAICVPVD
ncbi:MAG TPA: 4'-phosphopantetheinyl transferase superfamily protein [Micromonosporaceae bacterium]|jgi:4'-phosphopantetheinyl transferase EntD